MPSHVVRSLAGFAAVALVATLGAGCASGPAAASPGPSQACLGTDPSGPRYYPDLEARLATTWNGKGPSSLVSGRYCSSSSLGSLASGGISELRFAAAEWVASDNESTLTMLVYEAPGLTATLLATEFERAARATQGMQSLAKQDVHVAGRTGVRIDAALSSSRQTRIVWPSTDANRVDVVIASGVTEDAITSAEAAFPG